MQIPSLEDLGGRRFILAMLTEIVTTVLVWFAKIDGGAFVTITLGVVGAIVTGHTIENIKANASSTTIALAEVTK